MTERYIAVKNEMGFYASVLLNDYTEKQREFLDIGNLKAPGIPNGFYLNCNEISIGYQKINDGEWVQISEENYYFYTHQRGMRKDKFRRIYVLTNVSTLHQCFLTITQ